MVDKFEFTIEEVSEIFRNVFEKNEFKWASHEKGLYVPTRQDIEKQIEESLDVLEEGNLWTSCGRILTIRNPEDGSFSVGIMFDLA